MWPSRMGYRKIYGHCSLSLSLTEALDAWDHPEFYFLFPLEFVFTASLGKWFWLDCYFCDVALVCDDTPIRAHDLIFTFPSYVCPGGKLGGMSFYIGLYMCDATMGCVDALYWALDFITSSLRWCVYNNHRETACYTVLVLWCNYGLWWYTE